MRRFRDPSRWTWWLMGGATIAVGTIWYLVDQKFQDSSASRARDAQLEKRYSSKATSPELDNLSPAQLPNSIPNQSLPQGLSPTTSKLTLQKPDSSVPPISAGAGTMNGKSLPNPTFTNPSISTVVIPQMPSATVSAAPAPVPLSQKRPSTESRTAIASPSLGADRPGALLPNLPDPMERYQSGTSSAARIEAPITQPQPAPAKKASIKSSPSKTLDSTPSVSADDDGASQAQMPELFSSGQGGSSPSTNP